MKCPTCDENTPDAWKTLIADTAWNPRTTTMFAIGDRQSHRIQFDWMTCANEQCGQAVVRVHDTYRTGLLLDSIPEETTDTWLVHPRHRSRPVDPLVLQAVPGLARDYAEAVAILDLSHRMAAVLARSILADLLETYAGLAQFSLAARVNKFIHNKSHPFDLREDLHYLREIGDMSAHTKTNDQSEKIEVSPEETEWTLAVLGRLFDYFIVSPAKSANLRQGIDKKLASAERQPIKPLSPDTELPSEEDGGEATADREDAQGS